VRDIARQLELSETRVRNDIAHALANLQEQTLEDANQLRVLELARLDEMQATLWQKVRDGNLKAVDRVMRIMERRSRLMGLDAAARMEHTGVSITPCRFRRRQWTSSRSSGARRSKASPTKKLTSPRWS
jgi:hypothetical protein